MSGKLIAAAAAALIASTTLAFAQPREFPQDRFYRDYDYYGGPVYPPAEFGFGVAPYGYYGPGYYDYAPGWRYNNSWYDNQWN